MLALDEPTTNLDNDNKEGLAAALAELVDTETDFPMTLCHIGHKLLGFIREVV